MHLTDELERLQALHDNGTLTNTEFDDAKAKVLADAAPPAAPDPDVQRDLKRLQLQSDLLRLDQDWSTERSKYMTQAKSGPAYVPTIASSIVPALLFTVLAIVFFAGASSVRQQPNSMPYMGILCLIMGLVYGIGGILKTNAYNAAYGQYQQKRTALNDQLAALGE